MSEWPLDIPMLKSQVARASEYGLQCRVVGPAPDREFSEPDVDCVARLEMPPLPEGYRWNQMSLSPPTVITESSYIDIGSAFPYHPTAETEYEVAFGLIPLSLPSSRKLDADYIKSLYEQPLRWEVLDALRRIHFFILGLDPGRL